METIIGSLLRTLGSFIHIGLIIYLWCIIIRVLISWLSPDPYHPAVQFLYRITDPVLDRAQRFIPLQFGGIDFSPIIIIVFIQFIDKITINVIDGISSSLMGYQAFHGTQVVSYLIIAVAEITESIIWILMILFIIRAILSFIKADPYNPIVQFIYRATEPSLSFFRSRLPLTYEEFDLSPLLVLIILFLLNNFILTVLSSASHSIIR
jgi:YggT family protein